MIDGLVECVECKQWKAVGDFPVAAKKCETSTGTRPYCWPCQRTLDRKWNAVSTAKHDPVRARKRLLHRYGITGEQFDAIFASQGSVCAICKIDKNPCQKNWVVDHCHKTGKVRGVLCGRCNSALGMMRDDIQVVSTALDYLKKHEGSLT